MLLVHRLCDDLCQVLFQPQLEPRQVDLYIRTEDSVSDGAAVSTAACWVSGCRGVGVDNP